MIDAKQKTYKVERDLVSSLIGYFNEAKEVYDNYEASLYLMSWILLAAHNSSNPNAMTIAAMLNSDVNIKGIEEMGKYLSKEVEKKES